jgi:hypothetical protein
MCFLPSKKEWCGILLELCIISTHLLSRICRNHRSSEGSLVSCFLLLGSILGLSPEAISLFRVGWILVTVCRVMM